MAVPVKSGMRDPCDGTVLDIGHYGVHMDLHM